MILPHLWDQISHLDEGRGPVIPYWGLLPIAANQGTGVRCLAFPSSDILHCQETFLIVASSGAGDQGCCSTSCSARMAPAGSDWPNIIRAQMETPWTTLVLQGAHRPPNLGHWLPPHLLKA